MLGLGFFDKIVMTISQQSSINKDLRSRLGVQWGSNVFIVIELNKLVFEG
jgi:hypothetical protein